jgi:pimeloyl-ACP methyl ester carboxylesterase
MVVVGDGDRIVPVADAEKLAGAIRGARFVTVSGAGHLPCIEAPAAFNAALKEFVDGLPP